MNQLSGKLVEKAAKPSLSAVFQELLQDCEQEELTYRQLVDHFARQGQPFFILVLSFPFLLSAPGLSIPFGILVMIAGMRMAMGLELWIPKRWEEKKLPRSSMLKICRTALSVLSAVEKILHPRAGFLTEHRTLQQMHGLIIAICGFLLALPLPPGTNFPPALPIILLALGMLEYDGLFVVAGYIAFLFNLFFFFFLGRLGWAGLQWLFS